MNFEFIFPLKQLPIWLGLALLALGGLFLALYAQERRHRSRVQRFAQASLVSRLLVRYDPKVRRPLFWMPLAGFVFLALAFAQPHWGQAWREVNRASRDIIVCLDTSESMRAANPLPTRLDRAKQKIMSVLDTNPGDRFALVAFAGAADLECPLTLDHGYYKVVLNATDTDTISEEGTDIAAALHEAVKAFKEEAQKSGVYNKDSRAIILISDGEQVEGDAIKEAEEAAKYAHVYVIGVGDPNGTEIKFPDWMGKYVAPKDGGKPHISKLDEETLSKVALMGGGGYVRSTPDNADIKEIYGFIEKLSSRAVSSDVRMRLVNRYQWPLILAILCFAGEGLWLALLPWLRRFHKAQPVSEDTSGGEANHA